MGNCFHKVMSFFKVTKTYHISGKKLRELHQIAEGGYGYVLLVEDIDSSKRYALKKLICQTQEQRQSFRHQVEMMKKLSSCKHVIGYYGSHQIQRDGFLEAYILMELAQKTVYDLLAEVDKRKKPLNETQILKILTQTVIGLKQIHDIGIIHQDVKVQNILLTLDGTAKLCDFGSCSTQKIDFETVPKSKIYTYEQRFEKNTTLMYRPPEMIDLYLKYPVDDRVDIWMLGCVLFVLNYHYHPFQEEGKLSIVNANIRYGKGMISQKMEDLMRHMLTPNPYFRPRIHEVLSLIESWNSLDYIPLNKVAATIKSDEEAVQRGQYSKVSNGEWRNLKE